MDLISGWIESASAVIGLRPWAVMVFLIVLVALLIDFIQRRLMKRLEALVSNTANLWDDAVFKAGRRPLSLLIWLIGITLAVQAIPVVGAVEGDSHLLATDLVINIRQIGVLFAIAWFLVSFVKNTEQNIIESARRNEREIDQTTVHALGPGVTDHDCRHGNPDCSGYPGFQHIRTDGRGRNRWSGGGPCRKRHAGKLFRRRDRLRRPPLFGW